MTRILFKMISKGNYKELTKKLDTTLALARVFWKRKTKSLEIQLVPSISKTFSLTNLNKKLYLVKSFC